MIKGDGKRDHSPEDGSGPSSHAKDTDCLTAVARGIAAALLGAASIPPQLIKQTDDATVVNPHTNSKRTLRETSDGLYQAFKARLGRLQEYVTVMDIG